MEEPFLLNEYAYYEWLSPVHFDAALLQGWRHFGDYFFRYSEMTDEKGYRMTIQPLRLELAAFKPSKSQLRIMRKNQDTSVRVGPTRFTPELDRMFQSHKCRFDRNVPESLENFLGPKPGEVVPNLTFSVYQGPRLIAASFLDVGQKCVSSVYAMFDREEGRRSLGFFTMLAEIQWATSQGYQYYFPGYGSEEPSVYDYKKAIQPLSRYDWQTQLWVDLETSPK
jgi:leucyl-tRNA---protein transferase